MPGELERLAFDLSLRALSQQEHVVEELRSRTGTLLAVSSVAASFLGARALDRGMGWIAVCALVAFLVSVTSSLYILFPNRRLRFTLTGGVVLRDEYPVTCPTPMRG